ncbi:adapter protein CIKS [Notolabrus celidotus]|uniref:adapter protein CIKS n=1 Tax=Notolabrus celidotus TaxID=1203425 RepID=UPI00148F70C7|nr:adapter protein CIKS [Notolabrus celidotus]XP_034554836.1 adapter protein CIKS [Notolabrus celidotus]XP_034554837.1 adapter protein CIKS [Notolabrus celidotus]
MDSSKGPCPHMSVPVEMDESMTPSSVDLAFAHSCKQCSEDRETTKEPQEYDCEEEEEKWRPPESQFLHAAPKHHFIPPTSPGHVKSPHPAGAWPCGLREQAPLYEQDFMVNHSRGFSHASHKPEVRSVEEAESLEPPLPLLSDANSPHYVPQGYSAARVPGPTPIQRRCLCCPPANLPHHSPNDYYNKHDYPAGPRLQHKHPQPAGNPPNKEQQFQPSPNAPWGPAPRCAVPPRDVMHEVGVDSSLQPGPGPVTREIKRVISLPEESRNVFVTYSVDVAEDIVPFVKFLNDQGFRPAIDIFDDTIQRMSITKWMDRYLNDKSVLIIVVISPRYKEDVEGHGDDEHGLHTKYIHNQIQNEFIRQGCLNFRLVPVLFPNATKRHVPNWLQSTRIYRWPQDNTGLLLRLLREERYIIPPRGGDLTLTVRPV